MPFLQIRPQNFLSYRFFGYLTLSRRPFVLFKDIEEDDKNKSFNIFLLNKENKKDIKFILELCLANCANAYEELIKITEKEINADNINFINAKGVIDNLFYVGMRHITETKVGKLNESL